MSATMSSCQAGDFNRLLTSGSSAKSRSCELCHFISSLIKASAALSLSIHFFRGNIGGVWGATVMRAAEAAPQNI
jgi:hypothetical protein